MLKPYIYSNFLVTYAIEKLIYIFLKSTLSLELIFAYFVSLTRGYLLLGTGKVHRVTAKCRFLWDRYPPNTFITVPLTPSLRLQLPAFSSQQVQAGALISANANERGQLQWPSNLLLLPTWRCSSVAIESESGRLDCRAAATPAQIRSKTCHYFHF